MPDHQIAVARRAPVTVTVQQFASSFRPTRINASKRLGWYLRLHLCCLVLYSFLGKGFAYLGTGSFYVSEVLLVVGLFALSGSRTVVVLCRNSVGVAMIAFLLWESTCVLPYFEDYGLNVARDAMVWGYSAFGWIVAGLIVASPIRIELSLERYRRFVPWFLVLGPVALMISLYFSTRLPTWPGTIVPFISVKLDEFEAHLGGIAAFLVTGLSASGWWAVPLSLDFILGAPNRGGLGGFVVAFLVASIMARRLRALLFPVITLAVLLLAMVLDVHVTIPGAQREFSAAQILDDFGSTVSSDVDTGNLENTREWRLNWWQTIWDYTVNGPYFWTGKGYGINLANDDGFQTDVADQSLRSPHNSHMTFLARSGVPGFLLWITLQLTWLASMFASFLQAKRSGKPRWSALFIWVIAYWVAFVTAASFDVFLENPMAAVPFWTVFGLGWGSHLVFRRYPETDLRPLISK